MEATHKGIGRWRYKGLEFSQLCIALIRGNYATGADASLPPGLDIESLSSPSVSSSVSLSPSSTVQSFIEKRKAQWENTSQRKKSTAPKVNRNLGEQLAVMNANVARVATQLEKDWQAQAMERIQRDFRSLSARYKDVVLDYFESEFKAKRFVVLETIDDRVH
ncbi:hypothetical protein CC80DRAFT_124126 [Byssothecium circinans]|uniref:Uncharacterized protein n=1 Tax=Byssothecium circinans TaxID=147558 RepID=A0A6A5TNJ2_9PLEO|nr:hypothetical protein CC80DRAFT_124126 [Byssothecium circinans]